MSNLAPTRSDETKEICHYFGLLMCQSHSGFSFDFLLLLRKYFSISHPDTVRKRQDPKLITSSDVDPYSLRIIRDLLDFGFAWRIRIHEANII